MELDEKDLKELARNIEGGDGCPDPEFLLKVATSESTEEEKFVVIDHIFKCTECRQKFESLKAFYAEGQKLIEGKEDIHLTDSEVEELNSRMENRVSGTKMQSRRPFLKYILPLAATFLLVLGSIWVMQNPEQTSTHRGNGNEKVRVVSPKAEYRGTQLKFVWESQENVKCYMVKLYNEELTPIWKSNKIQQTFVKLPQTKFDKMKKNKLYFWRVMVYYSNGDKDKSPLQDFKIVD